VMVMPRIIRCFRTDNCVCVCQPVQTPGTHYYIHKMADLDASVKELDCVFCHGDDEWDFGSADISLLALLNASLNTEIRSRKRP
jgi:hypothetical protein